jgi:glycosyltransferase involved in cell wall biosynthesis
MGDRVALLFATSGHSGVDRVIANLLPEFGRAAARFDLLGIRDHGPWVDPLPDNVDALPLRARHRDLALPELVAYLRRRRPRALLTAGHRLNRVALAARALARVDTRIVIRMGMSLTAKGQEMSPRARRRLFRSMRWWYPRADAVVAPSEGVGADLVSLAGVDPERLHVIPNPIVTPRLPELAGRPVNDPWFAPGGPSVILGVGALEPRKDFATLLRACAHLRGDGRALRLLVLGEGPERSRLEGLAAELGMAETCRLPGHVGNPYPYMARAAALVLSSRREGSGAVVVEALACGTPVVATDCPSGPRESLGDGRYGPLVPVGDAAALARAIARVLDDPPPADLLRDGARRFDARHSAARYLDALGLPGDVLP